MKNDPTASIGFVGTYPPTVCGIASYTASIVEAVAGQRNPRCRVGVVGLIDRRVGESHAPVVFHHRTGNTGSLYGAIGVLNSFDTVSIQHEFGIFGGRDGSEVIDLMEGLTVPTAVTLHTVLNEPTENQRDIVERICDLADRIVVMSETASVRLVERYGVDPDRISVIPHGVDDEFAGHSRATRDRPLILTWGLIGPGKGLELAIEACAGL
ncbi:MAG: glycosyltransferase, partial [Acidimicrobiia bacterium]